jgi:hypothetical protein
MVQIAGGLYTRRGEREEREDEERSLHCASAKGADAPVGMTDRREEGPSAPVGMTGGIVGYSGLNKRVWEIQVHEHSGLFD